MPAEPQLRLWHYSEGILDPAGYWLEVAENNEPAKPDVGRSILWLHGTDVVPILKYEADCYVVAIAGVNHPVRFEQRHWIVAFLFGSGVQLSSGDSWHETIAQKQVCFRFQIRKTQNPGGPLDASPLSPQPPGTFCTPKTLAPIARRVRHASG